MPLMRDAALQPPVHLLTHAARHCRQWHDTGADSQGNGGFSMEMNDSIDWTDETLRSLDELARIAFPPGRA
jgi:hypothetical protein